MYIGILSKDTLVAQVTVINAEICNRVATSIDNGIGGDKGPRILAQTGYAHASTHTPT